MLLGEDPANPVTLLFVGKMRQKMDLQIMEGGGGGGPDLVAIASLSFVFWRREAYSGKIAFDNFHGSGLSKLVVSLFLLTCFCFDVIQKRPFVHNSVCSQFLEGLFAIWLSVRNSA